MLHGAGGTGGLPPSPYLHLVVDTFLFLCLSVLFLCCPPLCLMLRGAGGTGDLRLGFNFYAHDFYFFAVYCRISLHLHVSILSSIHFFFMLICLFFMLSLFFSYAPWCRWDGGLPPSPCFHLVVDTFLFYANLSFAYAVPLFFLCSMAQVGRGVSLHLHISILLSTRFFFCAYLSFSYLVPLFVLCSVARAGRGISDWALIFMLMVFIFMLSTAVSPSISMSPSCRRYISFLC